MRWHSCDVLCNCCQQAYANKLFRADGTTCLVVNKLDPQVLISLPMVDCMDCDCQCVTHLSIVSTVLSFSK